MIISRRRYEQVLEAARKEARESQAKAWLEQKRREEKEHQVEELRNALKAVCKKLEENGIDCTGILPGRDDDCEFLI